MSKKTRVGILYGGKSGEHHVSVTTAFSVIQAFDFDKYEIVPFYITQKGEWRKGPLLTAPASDRQSLMFGTEDRVAIAGHGDASGVQRQQSDPAEPAGGALTAAGNARRALIANFVGGDGDAGMPEIVIPLLHGTYGEDGTVQGLLEMAGIPYVGAGVLASAAGMDKVIMKKLFAEAGLPQCIYRHFTRTDWEKDREEHLLEIEVSLGYPCFVKPANLGSSVGVSKAANRSELIAAVELAFRFDRKVIVEEFVDAREIEVGILGNDEPRASVCGEIVTTAEFYDYHAKYSDGKSSMIIPADLPQELSDQIREMAIRAFKAIDASGLSRVDFFLRREDGAVLINEINTMPGFTPFSMYPLLWKETGVSYTELLEELMRLALERHAAKEKLVYALDGQEND
jgi:D-alanine-D-alanine ligase